MDEQPSETAEGAAGGHVGAGTANWRRFLPRLSFSWSRAKTEELVPVLGLLALCVTVRLLRLTPIEYYEDEVAKWHFARQWFYDNDFRHSPWTQHMGRVGINALLFVVQAVLGRDPEMYYAAPVLSSIVQTLLVYALGRRLHSRAAGLLAAVLLTVFTGMDRGASQLMPDGFGATAMITTCYLVVRYHDAPLEKRTGWLVGCGLAMLWGYLIKESNLLFLPGVAVAIWIGKRKWRDALLVAAIPVVGMVLETLSFKLLTDYGNRLAIIQQTEQIEIHSYWDLFARILKLNPPWQMMFWMWVPSALFLLGSKDSRARAVVLIPMSFVFLLTFLIKGTDPIIIWTRFLARYFEPVGPFFALAICLFATQAFARIWEINTLPSWRERLQWLPRSGPAAGALACLAVAYLVYTHHREDLATHPLRVIPRWAAVLNDAYARNLPIVEKRAKRGTIEEYRVRPLKLVYGVYLDDRLLATSDLAKGGRLPDILEAVRNAKRYSYVLRNASVYDPGEIEDYVEKGCAVVLADEDRHLAVKSDKLPKKCKAPRR